MKNHQDSNCNRRMSRVARSILVHDALPIFKYYHQLINSSPSFPRENQRIAASITTDGTLQSSRKSNKRFIQPDNNELLHYSDRKSYATDLQLYSQLFSFIMTRIHESYTDNPHCILDYSRDPYWIEEAHFYSTRARTMTTLSRFLSSSLVNSQVKLLHVCGQCGKSFISRQYLDLHWQYCQVTKKTHMLSTVNVDALSNQHGKVNDTVICPATDWCSFLGICPFVAHDIDPIHTIDKSNNDDNTGIDPRIHLSCHDLELDKSRTNCYEKIHQCFHVQDDANEIQGFHSMVASMEKDLIAILCKRQTCQSLVHSMALAQLFSSKTRWDTLLGYSRHETWNRYHQHDAHWTPWTALCIIVLWVVLMVGVLIRVWSFSSWNQMGASCLVDESRRKKLN